MTEIDIDRAIARCSSGFQGKDHEDEIKADGNKRADHRVARLVERIKNRHDNFQRCIGKEACGVERQGLGGVHGVKGGEAAVLEDEAHDGQRPEKQVPGKKEW